MALHAVAGFVWHIAGMSISNGKQSRIDVRSSPEFYDTLKGAAKRAQLSVSDYTRLALSERMALDELGVAAMNQREETTMAFNRSPKNDAAKAGRKQRAPASAGEIEQRRANKANHSERVRHGGKVGSGSKER